MADAFGNTKRTAGASARRSSGTSGTKSLASAPRPCMRITANSGFGAVSISTVDGESVMRTPYASDDRDEHLHDAHDGYQPHQRPNERHARRIQRHVDEPRDEIGQRTGMRERVLASGYMDDQHGDREHGQRFEEIGLRAHQAAGQLA